MTHTFFALAGLITLCVVAVVFTLWDLGRPR